MSEGSNSFEVWNVQTIQTGEHVAILRQPYLDMILDGKKVVESRLSARKIAPYGRVHKGDLVYLKLSGGDIVGTAVVDSTVSVSGTNEWVLSLRDKWNDQIHGDDAYWESKSNARYGTLIWLTDIQRITPIPYKKRDSRAWVVVKGAVVAKRLKAAVFADHNANESEGGDE